MIKSHSSADTIAVCINFLPEDELNEEFVLTLIKSYQGKELRPMDLKIVVNLGNTKKFPKLMGLILEHANPKDGVMVPLSTFV